MPALQKPLTEKQKAAVAHFKRTITFSAEYDEVQRQKAAVLEAAMELSAKIGGIVRGGDVYAGISPDTGERMYARAQDEKPLLDFNAAAKRAEELSRETGKAYRIPTINELNVLFNNKAAIGNFNTGDSNPDGWYYWSSTPYNDYSARYRSLSDGKQHIGDMRSGLSVRPLRS